jgi:LPPG:FO 2-phospho-L-lactate transferase
VILFCPSNPVVSIGPILAVEGIRDAVAASAAPKLAVSPIVGGAAIKGPASQLLRGIGVEVSALGVARHYRELIDGFVFDERDQDLAKSIADLSLRVRVTDTMMVDANASARLAAQVLELAGECA